MKRIQATCTVLTLAASLLSRAEPLDDGGISQVHIFHRLVVSGDQRQRTWEERGVVTIHDSGAPSVNWSSARDNNLLDGLGHGDLYQVGYKVEENADVDNYVSVSTSSLKLQGSALLHDTITLYMPPEAHNRPLHMAYRVSPHNVCSSPTPAICIMATETNTTIRIRRSSLGPSPILLEPVVVQYQPDGTIQKPEPEKSFIQKYWMYIVPVLLVLLLSGGSDDSGSNGRTAARQ